VSSKIAKNLRPNVTTPCAEPPCRKRSGTNLQQEKSRTRLPHQPKS
jgi:hypothetical protein